jgi:hypothetical protein
MLKFYLITCFTAISFICSSQSIFVADNNWLAGEWQSKDKGNTAEFSIEDLKTSFKGVGKINNGSGEDEAQNFTISVDKGRWSLHLKLDKGEEITQLKLNLFSPGLMRFERTEKAFPKRVTYTMVSANIVSIVIEGFEGHRLKRKEFYLIRKKQAN